MTTISRGFSGRLVILVSIFTLIVTAAGLAQSSKQEPTTSASCFPPTRNDQKGTSPDMREGNGSE
jgi:hypothetical protein